MSEYKERDAMQLDEAGNYYCRHIAAMTRESLRSKSDIAAELGYRDMVIDTITKQRDELRDMLKMCVDKLDKELGFTGVANAAHFLLDELKD